MLSYLQSSSNAPLIGSPKLAPEGGMKLPPFPLQGGPNRSYKSRPPFGHTPRASFDSGTSASPITKQTLDHVQEECDYDPPLSKEAKSPAYPDGPICIYDPSIFLYLEPSRVEASKFDVIINVAREVLNPFAPVTDEGLGQKAKQRTCEVALEPNGLNIRTDFSGSRDNISEPQTAISDKSFTSALEAQTEENSQAEPSTPVLSRPEPEYIHIPWDHNTNVVDDLLRLCETIDERVRQKKRVLVHCQCGVSRSASLIVAYGLYKNPQLTVQEAYDAVKGRSRWIGPNMNLIYQLSEFKARLPKMSFNAGSASWHSWRLGSSRSGPTSMLTPGSISISPSKGGQDQPPLTAPFPKDQSLSVPKRADTLTPSGSQITDKGRKGDVSPGPSSAPPDMQWSMNVMASKGFNALPEGNDQPKTLTSPSSMEVEPSQPSPLRKLSADSALDTLKSPTSSNFPTMTFGPMRPRAESAATSLPMAMDIDPPQFRHSSMSPTLPPPPPPTRAAPVPFFAAPAPSEQPPTNAPPPTRIASKPKPSLTLKSSNDSLGNIGFSRIAPSFSSRQEVPKQHPRVLPLRQEAPRLPAHTIPSPQITFTNDDPPPTPSLLSPRAMEFTSSPFHRTVAGDLAGSSVFEQQGQQSSTSFNDTDVIAGATGPGASSPDKPRPSPMNLGFATPPAKGLTKKNSTIFEQLRGVPSGQVGEISEQTIEILPLARDERAKEEDPRSPVNIEGEAGLVRSIFDVL